MRNSPDTTAVDFRFGPACPVLVDGITLASRDPAAQAGACASPRDEPVPAQGAVHRVRHGVPPQRRGLARTVRVPIASVGGAGFHGPVLNAIRRGEDAVRVFGGVCLLAGYLKFFVLKRTRVSPPVLT